MLPPSGANNASLRYPRTKMAIPRTKHPDTNPALLSASSSVVQTVLTLHHIFTLTLSGKLYHKSRLASSEL